jgi:hypothetical protein
MNNSIYSSTKQLLQTENCVVWPSLGAFVVERKHARILENGEALAPVRFVSFNKKLTQSDGMLLNTIALANGLKYTEAESEYNTFVAYFKNELRNNNALTVGELGTFYYDNGHLSFSTNEALNIGLEEDFGLSNFKLTPVENTNGKVRSLSISPKLKWAAVLAIPLLTSAIWAGNSFDGNLASIVNFNTPGIYKSVETPSNIDNINVDSMLDTPSLPEAYFSNTHCLMSLDNSPVVVENSELIGQLSSQHLLVVGCFRSLENAESYRNSLNDENVIVAGEFKGLYRVSYGSYATKNEALKAMRKLRTNRKFKNAWMSKF